MRPVRSFCHLLVAFLWALTTASAQQSPYQINALTCPAVMPTIQSCYDINDFALHYGTGAGRITYTGMGSAGTGGFVPRFATGGINLENSSLFNDPTTGNLGLRTTTPAEALHIIGQVGGQENIQLDMYRASGGGVGMITKRARGTLALPVRLNDNDILGILNNTFGYVRNATDTADEFVQLGVKRFAINGLDAQGRAGARIDTFLSPGGSAPIALVHRVTPAANNIVTGELQTAGVRVGHNLSVYAAGTAYALTVTPALLDFGTTDPTLTINQPGTYLLHARAALRYNAATFAANQTVTVLVQRTNNTPGAVANSTITLTTRIITTVTDHMAVATFPTLLYVTANSDDALELQGSVSVVPSAGSLDTYEASLVAVRLY